MSMQPEAVTATLIPEGPQRLNFLPATFGRYFMRGESLVYAWMRKLSEDYSGGFWHYYTLSNGGHYMAPEMGDARLTLLVEGNGYEKAAGLTHDMPVDWRDAIERARRSEFLRQALGPDLHRTFTEIKHAEYLRVARTVSELDYHLYMHEV